MTPELDATSVANFLTPVMIMLIVAPSGFRYTV